MKLSNILPLSASHYINRCSPERSNQLGHNSPISFLIKTDMDIWIWYLFPSGCVMTTSRSPQEAFPRLYDPPHKITTFKTDITILEVLEIQLRIFMFMLQLYERLCLIFFQISSRLKLLLSYKLMPYLHVIR